MKLRTVTLAVGILVVLCRPLVSLALETSRLVDVPVVNERLAGAVWYSLETERVDLLTSLIRAGLEINEPLCDEGDTILHEAALYPQTNTVALLLRLGASRDVRNACGQRPIDKAFIMGNTNVCEVLASPERAERIIGDWSEGVLREIFLWDSSPLATNDWYVETFPFGTSNRVTYVMINDKPAQAEVVEWLMKFWPNVHAVKLRSDGQLDREVVVAGSTGSRRTVQVRIDKKGPREYRWIKRCDDRGICIFARGRLVQKYGTWLRLPLAEDDPAANLPMGGEWLLPP